MKTHYLIGPKKSACNLDRPRRATKRVQSVDCPACHDWINKNLEIRCKKIFKAPAQGDDNAQS